LEEVLKGKDSIKNLRWLLTLLLNEGADEGEEPLTEMQIGKMVHAGNLKEVTTAVYAAFSVGNKGSTEPTEDVEPERENDEDEEGSEGKNAQSGEVS